METSLNPYPANLDLTPVDFRSELNDEQFAAVTAEPGPALVLAGAGSGKTRTLTYRVAWLLSQGVSSGAILLLTFTNKASKEMLQRVEELTGVTRHQFWGGTFHHLGQKTLRIYGKSIGLEPSYTILDQGDAETLLRQTIQDLDQTFLKNKEHPKAKVLLDIISLARNTQGSLSEIILQRYPFFESLSEAVENFNRVYQKRKLERQVADYDDLLEYWLKLLKQEPEVATYFQERFKHILVDEYQDTNPLQAEIIDRIGRHHQIMAVGDEAQCIYSWRGANFENIMTFPQRHPDTAIYKIETNYRSTPQILSLANSILAAQPKEKSYGKKLLASRKPHQVPFIVPMMDSRQQAHFVISRMEGLLDQGYLLSQMAVLYRAHYQALDLQIELSRQGIPFVITSGVRFFEQAHIKDIVAQLRFACNPQDFSAFLRFSNLLPKIGEKSARRLYQRVTEYAASEAIPCIKAMLSDTVTARVPASARDDWKSLATTLQDIDEAVRQRGPQEAVRVAIEGWYDGFIRNIFPNWQSRLEDLQSLIGFAGRFQEMAELLAQFVLLNSETSDRSIEKEGDFLRLTTIHQAKGLEYPIVFVIGLADGLFPLKRAVEEDQLEEERRLFYVAVTRAKDELYLSYPMINAQGGPSIHLKPSRFLQELPKEHYEILRVRAAPSTRSGAGRKFF